MAKYSNILKSYKFLVKKLGYEILYDLTDPNESSVFFFLQVPTPEESLEPSYAFYQIFEMADLSLEGYDRIVLKGKDVQTFVKLLEARVKGCTVSKSEIIYGLLQRRYLIDNIYKDGKLNLDLRMIDELSYWVNFKGGTRPVDRENRKR